MNQDSIYRRCLANELEPCGMNQGQLDKLLGDFDKLAESGSGELGFRIIHQAYASGDTEKAVKTIKAIIEEALEAANKATVDKNPKTRALAYIRRLHALIDKAAVTVDGKDMTREELDAAKAVPAWAKGSAEFVATASSNPTPKFAMTVTL